MNLSLTIDAVVNLLKPLEEEDLVKRVTAGPREQLTSYPAIWVWYGPMEVRHETTIRQNLNRHTIRQIRASIYVKRAGMLPMAYMRLVPLIDAVTEKIEAVDSIEGVSDRLVVSGYGEAGIDDELDAVAVDVFISSEWIDDNTYVNDWR